MGCSESVNLPPHFAEFQSWPAPKVGSMIKSYVDGEYDYGIDHTVVMTLTGLELEKAKVLIKALARGNSIVINATVLLLTVIMLSEPNRRVENGQLVMAFEVFDFNMSGSISFDEFSIMLLCIVSAQGVIIGEQEKVPTDATIIEAATALYSSVGKSKSLPISKEEIIQLYKQHFTSHGVNTIDLIFERFHHGKDVTYWPAEED